MYSPERLVDIWAFELFLGMHTGDRREARAPQSEESTSSQETEEPFGLFTWRHDPTTERVIYNEPEDETEA